MSWLMRLLRGRRLDRQLDAELRFHLDEETARLERQGVPAPEARRRALAAFGGFEPIREQTREARGTRWVHDLLRDARYGLRMMRRTPGFTLVAVLSLAVGIGANAAIFSVMDALMVRPLPIERPDETFVLNRTGFGEPNTRVSYPMVDWLQAQVPDAAFAAMTDPLRVQLTIGNSSELALGQLVSGNWFDLLGVGPAAGRLLAPSDNETIDAHPAVVLSHAYWRRRFGRDVSVIGHTVTLNNMPMTVIGVAAAGFDGVIVGRSIDVWAPVMMQHAIRHQTNASTEGFADTSKPWIPQDDIRWLTTFGRFHPRVDRDAVAARIDQAYRQRLADTAEWISSPEQRAVRLREHAALLPGAQGLSELRDTFSAPLVVLMATVAIVLLIACANLASLLLSRSVGREREFALRLSLGAPRSRVVRQLLTETTLLACLGGVAGLAIAVWGSRMLLRLVSTTPSAVVLDVGPNWRLVGFTLAAGVLTGLLFGLAPAWRLARAGPGGALQDRRAASRRGRHLGRLPFGRVLVTAQIALSVVLLAGALLFLRTLDNLLGLPAGFARDEVIAASFDPKMAGVQETELPGLYERLLERTRALPGASDVSFAYTGLVTGAEWSSFIVVEDRPVIPGAEDDAREDVVGPDYLRTVGLPLVRGRDFAAEDREGAPLVALVNQAFVRHFFGDADPIGRRFGYSADRPNREIIGVIADARIDGPRRTVPPLVLYPLAQHPTTYMRNLYVRFEGSATPIQPLLTQAITGADRRLAIREVVTLNDLTARSLRRERLLSSLTGAFAVLAVAVACLGLFGTVSYGVARRTGEIGLRIALGASTAGVRWMVLREIAWVAGTGCLVGLVLAFVSLDVVESLLFGLSAADPFALGGSAAALLTIGFLSALLPAWRAARVDPIRALRSE